MLSLGFACAAETSQEPSASQVIRQIGTVKAVHEDSLSLTTDSGSEMAVLVQQSTAILRTEPGQKDLRNATPIRLQEVQVGDRILVRGKASSDGHSVVAATLIVIRKTDIEEKKLRDREDWQKRGVGGLVKAVDLAGQTITISTAAGGVVRPVAVHISKETILRRYAPNSVKFDDAKPGTLDEIKPGDQLRARGERRGGGSDFAAEEIVTGAFRNIAGTIGSIDASKNAITVTDLTTKKPVLVRFAPDTSLRILPPMMAEGIANRLRGATSNGGPSAPPAGPEGHGPPTGGTPAGPALPSGRGAGPPDIQQMLSRLPPATFADLKKGEAVMIVSTQGTDSGEVTAISILGGVEPILRASPDSNQQMILSPWSLGGESPDTGAQ